MNKTEITAGIIRYQFPPQEDRHFGFNLCTLLDEETKLALLIDTGYEEHAALVLDDLRSGGYELKSVVISHFHPDHVLGLQALPSIEIMGSPRYEETLSQYGPREDWGKFIPTQVTKEDGETRFGRFKLRFRPAPRHAPCSQYTLIGDAFVHVADNVMTSNGCQDILPWAEFDAISEHIASLELLREFRGRTFLLSHGCELEEEQVQLKAIDNRIRYFRNILKGGGTFSYEEATRGCTCQFLHQEWLIRKEAD